MTIATRYSRVREQGNLPFAEQKGIAGEMSILGYRSQQYRLLTLLASAFVMNFAAQVASKSQEDLDARLRRRDFSSVSHVHGLMAGCKAWVSNTAAEGAEEARRCCGEQGYLSMSGLPEIVATSSACCTLEGDNVVMWQQTARYLMKTMDLVLNVKNKQTSVAKTCERGTSQLTLPQQFASCLDLLVEGSAQDVCLKGDPASLADLHQLSRGCALRLVMTAHTSLRRDMDSGIAKSEA